MTSITASSAPRMPISCISLRAHVNWHAKGTPTHPQHSPYRLNIRTTLDRRLRWENAELRGTIKDWNLGHQDKYVHLTSNSQHVGRTSSPSAVNTVLYKLYLSKSL